MRPNKIIHFASCGDVARLYSPASAHAPPANERSLSATVHRNRLLGSATTFGMCIMQTNRKNINPSKVDERRTNFLTVRLVAAANSAHPTKYAQNKCHGIHDGTISAIPIGPPKCSGANTASETAMKIQPEADELVPAASPADLFSKYKNSADQIDQPGQAHPEIY